MYVAHVSIKLSVYTPINMSTSHLSPPNLMEVKQDTTRNMLNKYAIPPLPPLESKNMSENADSRGARGNARAKRTAFTMAASFRFP
jgi:hypothetical protein